MGQSCASTNPHCFNNEGHSLKTTRGDFRRVVEAGDSGTPPTDARKDGSTFRITPEVARVMQRRATKPAALEADWANHRRPPVSEGAYAPSASDPEPKVPSGVSIDLEPEEIDGFIDSESGGLNPASTRRGRDALRRF